MLKLSHGGDSLELGVLGYQYPFDPDEPGDDWLVLEVRWTRGTEGLVLSGASLTAQELVEFGEWLAGAAEGRGSGGTLTFLEPNLAFAYSRQFPSGVFVLQVSFGAEWAELPLLRFELPDLAGCLGSLRAACLRFPPREGGAP